MSSNGARAGKIEAVILKLSVLRREDRSGPAHLRKYLPDLEWWRSYYVETESDPRADQVEALAAVIGDPVTEMVVVSQALGAGQVQVAYKQGIVDNESDSVVELCRLVGVDAVAARLATTYTSEDPLLTDVISAHACNLTIEELHTEEPQYATLTPVGEYVPARRFDLRDLSDEQLIGVGRDNGSVLDLEKMQKIRAIQVTLDAPDVSDALLEALDARWSDHCAHTTWKSLGNLLKRLITAAQDCDNDNVVSMFHDNAGIWRFYDGWGIAIKAETHNGPTAVSAYFGQLTKVGGVLRDILGTGKGADPIGVFEYTATGVPGTASPVAGRPDARRIANETIRAIKEYGNTFGVPMMGSRMSFHPDYRAKPFALGGSIGVIPLEHAQKGKPHCGDHVMLVGGLTGDDGIHGGSSSSAGAVMASTAVQIGSPLEEIKFREAIVDLRDAGCLRALTDLGAAGINSAAGEIGEDTGIWINTALVPLKSHGLPMWRILLSESQERMMLAVAPEHLDRARNILQRHQVRNTVIGRFTDTQRYCVLHDPVINEDAVVAAESGTVPIAAEVGFDVPYELLDYDPPAVETAPPVRDASAVAWPKMSAEDVAALLPAVLADAEVTSQAYASLQYDSSVQGRTVHGPSAGKEMVPTTYYASRPVYGSDAAIVFSAAFDPWLFAAHPVRAARQCLLAAVSKQMLAGVALTDICLTDNFYTPNQTEDGFAWLVAMVDELADLSRRLGVPFISGKDSSAGSNRTDEGLISVPPGVYIAALGKVESTSRLRSDVPEGNEAVLVRIGLSTDSPTATVGGRALKLDSSYVDEVPLDDALAYFDALARLNSGLVSAGRVIGAGGVVATALAMAMSADVEIQLQIDDPVDALAEHRVGALICVNPERVGDLPAALQPQVVGRITGVTGAAVILNGAEMSTADALTSWRTSFEGALS